MFRMPWEDSDLANGPTNTQKTDTEGPEGPEGDELERLIRSLVAAILEDDIIPPWSTVSDRYWHTVASHIMTSEPDVVVDIKTIAQKIRTRFRTCAEHLHRVRMVTCTKPTSIEDDNDDNDDNDLCCVCLRPVRCTWQRTVRLKARDGDPTKCGHLLHASCANRLRPREDDECVYCPVCREMIGPSLRYWIDMESAVPEF